MSSDETTGAAAVSTPDSTPVLAADHALDVLLAVRGHVAPDLPEDLLKLCYAVQKQFQFDRDEQLPVVHTRRLVERFVEHEATARSEGHSPEGV